MQEARKRGTNVLTIEDIEKMGLDKTAEIALELAWKGVDAVYISFDVDSLDCGFVPGTGWPEPGGFLPREALKLLGLVAAEGICGFEVVEVSPPYDTSDITALLGVRVVVETLGSLVAHGKLGATRQSSTSRSSIEVGHASRTRARSYHNHDGGGGSDGRARGGRPRAQPRRAGRKACSGICRIGARGAPHEEGAPSEPDLDLIEAAFVDGFSAASDPTSFLRLAQVPFELTTADGREARAAAGRGRRHRGCRRHRAASRRHKLPLRPAAGADGVAPQPPALCLF